MNANELKIQHAATDDMASETQNNPALTTTEASQEAFNTWIKFLDIVKLNVSDLKLNTWFKPIKPKSIESSTLTIIVPSQDYYEMIISRFGDVITKAIRSILGDV